MFHDCHYNYNNTVFVGKLLYLLIITEKLDIINIYK